MKYKIIDTQGGGLMGDFLGSKDEVMVRLTSFHSGDWVDERYPNIEDWLADMDNDAQRLDELLDWGGWELEEVVEPAIKIPVKCECGNPTKMYWCNKCESNSEHECCDNCGERAILDEDYHLDCNK